MFKHSFDNYSFIKKLIRIAKLLNFVLPISFYYNMLVYKMCFCRLLFWQMYEALSCSEYTPMLPQIKAKYCSQILADLNGMTLKYKKQFPLDQRDLLLEQSK